MQRMPNSATGTSSHPVIVVSTGRCGSTLLSDMVRRHPDLLSVSEFFATVPRGLFSQPDEPIGGDRLWATLSVPPSRQATQMLLAAGADEMLYRPGPSSRFTVDSGFPPILLVTLPHMTDDPDGLYDELASWMPGLDPGPAHVQCRRLFAWLCDRLGKQTWVERSGSTLAYAGQLAEQFPEARIVHLHRDGRDCAVSMSRHGAFKMMYLAQRFREVLGVAQPFGGDGLPAAVPPELRPFLPQSFDAEAFQRFRVPVDEMGRQWSDMIVRGCEQLDRLPEERRMSIGFETLTTHPEASLRRLAGFIGVSADERWLAEAASLARPLPPRWTELTGDEQGRLSDACEPGMRVLAGQPVPDR